MQNRHVDLICETHAFAELSRDARENLLKHAYVFESADFDALYTLAAAFVCVCEYGKADELHLKRVFDGSYLDIVKLPRAEKNGKMDVEDATYLTDTAYFTPTELSVKYYIVAAEEPLSEAVQNKLLKTLEEPPESSRFIIFSRGGDLLPTVTSRASVVRLEEFSVERIERALKENGADDVTAIMAAALGRGNIGAAEKAAKDEFTRLAYECATDFLLNVKRSPQILPAASKMIALKERLPAVLDCFELVLRDIAAYNSAGAEAIILKPAARDIIALSREFDTRTCIKLMPLIARARGRLRLYGNAASIIDQLLFSILEVKAKCPK
ncbi:MAG: hypothetical protein HFE36_01800 [Clostridia bacterium]|nr:hypothetical protein [Clostridia bacterium]